MPTNADIYTKILEYNNTLKNAKIIDPKDLQPGFTYLTKKNEKLVFLEKHEKLDYSNQSIGQYYWFAKVYDDSYFYIESFKNVKGKFIKIFSDITPTNFDKMDKSLKKTDGYKSIKLDYTYEELNCDLEEIKSRIRKECLVVFYEDKYRSIWFDKKWNYEERAYNNYYCVEGKNKHFENLEIFDLGL